MKKPGPVETGRIWLNDDHKPVDKSQATMVRVLFSDGCDELRMVIPDVGLADDVKAKANTLLGFPEHGRVDCTLCFSNQTVRFGETKREEDGWRITCNPLAWGSPKPEVVVLGFSKGPTQAGATSGPHDEIAYKGRRGKVGEILAHLGLLPNVPPDQLKREVDRMIADRSGRFHFGSFIRCTVERLDAKSGNWMGSGGGILDKFVATPFGHGVATRCATRFLGSLPPTTKLVVMFGLGSKLNYVEAALKVFKIARPGNWQKLNKISYTDGVLTVVHVEHFSAQGPLIRNWLGRTNNPRARLGELARESVRSALSRGESAMPQS